MNQQFIHGIRYTDEQVMIRVKDKGDLYVHQAERDQGGSVKDWNVVALTDLAGSVVERYTYTPYGEVTVYQETAYGDRDGDQDVDATDKGVPGTDCTGTVTGACRVLDFDFDGDYDTTDGTTFDGLPQGLSRHPGLRSSGVDQPLAYQGLLFEPEIGSYQNRARQYNPKARRFSSPDPCGDDDQSKYAYIRSNPISRLDPSGAVSFPATVSDESDRIVVSVSVAVWGWGIDDADGGNWFDVELGEFGPWNVPGRENGQGAQQCLMVDRNGNCLGTCKPVKFNFDARWVPSLEHAECSDVQYGGDCAADAREIGRADVSVYIRPPTQHAVIDPLTCVGTPGRDGGGGGAVRNNGLFNELYVFADYAGVPPFDLSLATPNSGEELHVLAHEMGHIMRGEGHDTGGDNPMMAGNNFTSNAIRIVRPREIIKVLNANPALGLFPAKACQLGTSPPSGPARGKSTRPWILP